MNAFRILQAELKSFHNNEEGMETLQVVMIIAIAAIMLLLVKVFWENIAKWFASFVNAVTSWGESTETVKDAAQKK